MADVAIGADFVPDEAPIGSDFVPDAPAKDPYAAYMPPSYFSPQEERQAVTDLDKNPYFNQLARGIQGMVPNTLGKAAEMAGQFVVPITKEDFQIPELYRNMGTPPGYGPQGHTFDQFTKEDWQRFLADQSLQGANAIVAGLPFLHGAPAPEAAPEAAVRETMAPEAAKPPETVQPETARVQPEVGSDFVPDQAEQPQPNVASVPVMITKKMEADLRARGFSQAAIDRLTPEQAHGILQQDLPPETPSATVPTPDEFGREISQSETSGPGETTPGQQPPLAAQEQRVAQPEDTGVVAGGGQEAPIGASNRVAQAREEANLLGEEGAPESGVGVGYRDSVSEGNQLIDKGVDPYKVVSEFQSNNLINRQRMGVMRAQLEKLQTANAKALGDLEADPANPELQQRFQDTSTAENAFWKAYQPMKTEWSNIGTGMQEVRGITDADLMNQASAESVMRDSLNKELNASDKARATKIVTDVRNAGAEYQTAMQRALDVASDGGKMRPRGMKVLAADLAETLKKITC